MPGPYPGPRHVVNPHPKVLCSVEFASSEVVPQSARQNFNMNWTNLTESQRVSFPSAFQPRVQIMTNTAMPTSLSLSELLPNVLPAPFQVQLERRAPEWVYFGVSVWVKVRGRSTLAVKGQEDLGHLPR